MMKTRHMTRRRGLEDGRDRALSTATTSTANSDPTSNRADSIDFGIDLSSSDGGGKSLSHLVKAHDDGGMGSSSHNFHISDRSSSIDYFMDSQMEATKKKPLDSPVAAGTRNAARRRAASTTPAPAIVPAVTATVSNPLSIPNAVAKAPSQAIPRGFPLHQQSHNSQQVQEQQHSSSHDSSGDAFLNGIMNNAAHISHTPPTALGTSYENDHFGKRQRSGSVSGRLRSASDLEEKGLIDRQQKGILKDLIICGDEDLQHALDQYEQGDPSILEDMIKSGALQNKSATDLDLLGDLDLDFLSVNDMAGTEDGLDAIYQGLRSRSNSKAVRTGGSVLPVNNPLAFKQHPSGAIAKSTSGLVSPEYDDGIGDLEFTGDFSHEHGEYQHDHESERQQDQAPSSPIHEDRRLRSNSLFSALINDPKPVEQQPAQQQYGQWMDRGPLGDLMQAADHVGLLDVPADSIDDIIAASTAVSRPIPVPHTDLTVPEDEEDARKSSSKTKRRRKSDSALTDRHLKAKIKQEIAEQKRREKQEKREQRDREKQKRKEERLRAKAEKKQNKDKDKKSPATAIVDDERPVHVSGSGMPRSLSDPNFQTSRDEFGHIEIERPEGWIGAYSPDSRKVRIDKFLAKRGLRVWTKTVKYDVRKNFADSRLRVKGRFVKKEDEVLMRDLMSLT